MSDLIPFTSNTDLSRPARRASRAISRHTMTAQVRVASVDAETDVTIAKVENYTLAASTGMTAVARVAKGQSHLEQTVPEVSGRLAYLADSHLLGVGELLDDLRRDLRRR